MNNFLKTISIIQHINDNVIVKKRLLYINLPFFVLSMQFSCIGISLVIVIDIPLHIIVPIMPKKLRDIFKIPSISFVNIRDNAIL